ncbi:MAG: elongation factor Ts [Firmicutes bacterium]|nr:elongation factor Ts [Candidatus Colivicinus equi]
MAVTAAQVKELREKTGAGMLDCKNALTASDGDMEKALDWLREKGIAKSIKKASRIAAEGLSKVVVDGNKASIVEINSETDFVAKNDMFLALLDTCAKTILAGCPKTNEEALALPVEGQTLNDLFINATATIGEKIVLRRFAVVEKADDEIFGDYTHMGGTKTCIVVLKGGDADLAHYMAMQVASMNPTYVSAADMPAEVVEHERKVQTEIVKNDEKFAGKPEQVINGAIEGKVSKSLKEMCLVDQEYFMDTAKKVSAVLKENNAEVKSFVRYGVGEGLEKREENFAEEVAKQIGA